MCERPSFEIDTVHTDGVTVVALSGEIDMTAADALQAAITGASGPVVLDLCSCGFVDSTIIGISLLRYNEAPDQFAIACLPTGGPALVFELTLQDIIPGFGSREEAVAALKSARSDSASEDRAA